MQTPCYDIWIVKAGTKLTYEANLFAHWAEQTDRLLHDFGVRTVWVLSGSIAFGQERLRTANARSHEELALSCIGQPYLLHRFAQALESRKLQGSQLLLTKDLLESNPRRECLRLAIRFMLDRRIVPIVNENDIATLPDNSFSSNDALAMQMAKLLQAKRLIFLTDVPGLLPSFETEGMDRQPIRELNSIDGDILRLCSDVKYEKAGSGGRGGMRSKLVAAREALRFGIETSILEGGIDSALTRIASGTDIGTLIRRETEHETRGR